jgi:uncharacterized glyoxalase superfamily protein PhnB
MIPKGYQAVCPYMTCRGADRALQFMVEVLGAEVVEIHKTPDGRIMNAEVKVRDSMLMLADSREQEPRPGTIYMYADDCDELYAQSIKAGATSIRPPEDMPYGDRHGGVVDPGGNHWWFASRLVKA